jgi:23S rRNA (guanosine2251-2'-O)-methyltransferase
MKNKKKKSNSRKRDFYVIAHNIRSILNVGSIFRTADAFSVTKIYLTGYTGTPQNPFHKNRMGKVALGAEEWVLWEHSHTAFAVIRQLKKQHSNITVIGLENNVKAGELNKFKAKFPLVLILGHEREGISAPLLKACDKVLAIPMLGKKESLNVAVAFGIAAYALINQ